MGVKHAREERRLTQQDGAAGRQRGKHKAEFNRCGRDTT